MEEVSAVCVGLRRIAEHTRDSEEIGRFFHDIIIPRLLGLCLQAALQSRDSGQGLPCFSGVCVCVFVLFVDVTVGLFIRSLQSAHR